MATEALKSNNITNADATPVTVNNSRIDGAMERIKVATIEVSTTKDVGSTYRFVRVPSNAVITQVLLYSDDIGTTTTADFGLYRTAEDGGAVVDADFFASAVSLKDGALTASDITHESGVFNIDDAEKPLYTALGLSADPMLDYDIVATLTGASDAAGTVTLKVRYTV